VPDDHVGSSHVSLRVPNDVLAAFDRLATELGRPRSWVMLRALRCYLEEEGAEIIEDGESIAELDRGEVLTSEEMQQRLQAIIERGRKARAQQK
jgi:predicted transcriptional regulator